MVHPSRDLTLHNNHDPQRLLHHRRDVFIISFAGPLACAFDPLVTSLATAPPICVFSKSRKYSKFSKSIIKK